MICIKNTNYGGMYVPTGAKAEKNAKKPAGENALDAVKEDIQRIRDEMIKKNRDNLDAIYNIDMSNMSSDMRSLFAKWTDGISSAVAGVKVVADAQQAQAEMYAQFKTEVSSSVASIKATANANSAQISSIASWQSGVNSSISSIRQSASSNSARIDSIASVVGENGDELVARVTVAVVNDESFIELVADRVTISGTAQFVTKEDLGDNGYTEVSGNRISMQMNGMIDNEYDEVESTSRLNFNYWVVTSYGESSETACSVSMKADGADTGISSRYALLLETYSITTRRGNVYNPAIKIDAAGRLSLRAYDGMYAYSGRYITLEGIEGTRIRAYKNYSAMVDDDQASNEDYVFAKDGIYYGGVKILST